MNRESVSGMTDDFCLLYFVINQFQKCNVMMPIIHTLIIGIMEM